MPKTKPKPSGAPGPWPPSLSPQGLLERSLPFHLLQNTLTYYADLPCFLLRNGDWKTWHTVVTLRQKQCTPIDFESFPQWQGRIEYNERTLARVARGRKALCLPHRGLHGLFVPVLSRGRCVGVLQSGAFLREVPSEAALLRLWKDLSGRPPRPNDEAFLEYVRAMADTPVLDGALVEGLRELLEVFGAFLTRSLNGAAAAARMAELQRTVFARRLWHRQWVEWQAIQPKFFRFNGDPKSLMQWEIDELGIRRFPTTVLAVKREGTGKEWADWLAAVSFQREALEVARGLGETLAYPLGNYGVLLLTSDEAGRPAARSDAEIGAKAARFAGRMARAFGCRVWVGIGSTDPTGTGLRESYHEAVAALHSAVARDKETVRYQDLPPVKLGETQQRRKVAALAQALLESGSVPATHYSGAFIQDTLIQTRGRPEATRRALMAVLQRLLAALDSRRGIADPALAELEDGVTASLEGAYGINEMVGRFEAALALVLSFLKRPLDGDRYLRLRKACEAVDAAPQAAWTLPSAARQFGFSPSSFSREFASHAGMPFSDFLLARRLDKAKRMLNDGLSLQDVADACGFRSVNYFMQVFKRKVGTPPGRFRKKKAAS